MKRVRPVAISRLLTFTFVVAGRAMLRIQAQTQPDAFLAMRIEGFDFIRLATLRGSSVYVKNHRVCITFSSKLIGHVRNAKGGSISKPRSDCSAFRKKLLQTNDRRYRKP